MVWNEEDEKSMEEAPSLSMQMYNFQIIGRNNSILPFVGTVCMAYGAAEMFNNV